MPGMATFAGSFARLFARSSKLVDALANLDLIKKLVSLIVNPDFNISSDSFETFKELFLNERADDELFEKFVNQNELEIFEMFAIL